MELKRKSNTANYRGLLLDEKERLEYQIRRIEDRTAGRDRLDSQISA